MSRTDKDLPCELQMMQPGGHLEVHNPLNFGKPAYVRHKGVYQRAAYVDYCTCNMLDQFPERCYYIFYRINADGKIEASPCSRFYSRNVKFAGRRPKRKGRNLQRAKNKQDISNIMPKIRRGIQTEELLDCGILDLVPGAKTEPDFWLW